MSAKGIKGKRSPSPCNGLSLTTLSVGVIPFPFLVVILSELFCLGLLCPRDEKIGRPLWMLPNFKHTELSYRKIEFIKSVCCAIRIEWIKVPTHPMRNSWIYKWENCTRPSLFVGAEHFVCQIKIIIDKYWTSFTTNVFALSQKQTCPGNGRLHSKHCSQ